MPFNSAQGSISFEKSTLFINRIIDSGLKTEDSRLKLNR